MTMRRPRSWADLTIDTNLAAGGAAVVNLLTNATVNLDTVTVTRIIGRVLCVPSVVANATVSIQSCRIGIGVASAEAFAIGVTAIPQPHTDGEAPPRGWLYKEQGTLINQQDSGTVEAWEFPEFKFDLRGQRKVDRGVLFMNMSQFDMIAGTTAVKFAGLVRVLCLT